MITPCSIGSDLPIDKQLAVDSPLALERSAFAARLKQALTMAGYDVIGASAVARVFNARSPVQVTPHAMRKWLRGECIASQAHVQTLAHWLKCDPAWLRYGQADTPLRAAPADLQDCILVDDLAALDARTRLLVYDFVELLLKADRS